MKYALFLLAAVFAGILSAQAITINVPGDYPTIQSGIDASVDGDTVLVAPDTYFERIDFSGREITVISSDGPQITIIDGEQQGPIVTINSGEGQGAVLEGFTITNGFHQGVGSAGVHCGSGTAPVIRGNIIKDNGDYWSGFGGGISAIEASPLIEQNQILTNICVYYGGGICLWNCPRAEIISNTIAGNYTGSGYGVATGGGIYAKNSTAIIQRNLILDNYAAAPGLGGGIAIEFSGHYIVKNNTISGNSSPFYGEPTGGGIYAPTGELDLCDNIVVNSPQGGGISSYWGTTVIETNFNDVWNNEPNYFGYFPGPYDISLDPEFVGGVPYSYELTETSPCIDAGAFVSELDADGTRSDMGAFPYDQVSMNVAIVPDGWPVVIPAAGGSFTYTLYLTNNTPSQVEFDVWVDARMPDGTIVGPLILRQDIVFNPDEQLQRSVTQTVPGGAMGGTYDYMVRTGDYSTSTVYHETTMPFVKESSDATGGDWSVSSQRGMISSAQNAIRPDGVALDLKAVPNPFNPVTILRFDLPASGHTTLTVYDLAGRAVTTLLDRNLEMGTHSVPFNGSQLASGIYLVKIVHPEGIQVTRILLMK